MPITFGSLFAGIGGFDLGFERAGMQCKWQVEIDDYATRVLEKHWPSTRRVRDIRSGEVTELERVDVICGGDPCQGNSIASAVYNTTHEDYGIYFVACVRWFMPSVVVRENPTVTKANALWPWRRMRDSLEFLGYVVLPIRVRASMFNLPQRRDRIILVGERANTNSERPQRVDWEGVAQRYIGRVRGYSMPQVPRAKNVHTGPDICGAGHGVQHRTHRLRCLGNAVVPQVAEYIGQRIVEGFNQGGLL